MPLFEPHPGRIQAQPIDIRFAPGRQQQMAALQDLFRAVGVDDQTNVSRPALDPYRPGAEVQANTLAVQSLGDNPGQFGVLAREDLRVGMHQVHLTAEPLHGLGHFDPDRPTADDNQAGYRLAQVEQGFVGQEGDLFESGNRRDRCACAGGEQEVGCREYAAFDLEPLGVEETALAEDHLHPKVAETLRAVVRLDTSDDVGHMLHHGRQIDLGRGGGDAEARRLALDLGHLGRLQQGLAGHAAGPEAVTAEGLFLDEGDLGPQFCRARGSDKPSGPAADHAKIKCLPGHDFPRKVSMKSPKSGSG